MNKKNLLTLAMITSLFFLWAFLHNLNPILIPHLRKAFQISNFQSAFIDSAIYLGYFVIAIPAGIVMQKHGYKSGLIIGLILYAIGCFLIIPAASVRSFDFFLVAFFIIAAGATFLETVANPYVVVLGDPAKAEQRLNFVQSFNGIGSFMAPIIGAKFILTGIELSKDQLAKMSSAQLSQYLQSEADTVKIPYLVIGTVVIVLLLLFIFVKLPEGKEVEIKEDGASHSPGTDFSISVFKHRHFAWSVAALFFYIGLQVGAGSFFLRYANEVSHISEKQAGFYWGSIAMVGFMVGRFAGTALIKYIKPAKLLSLYAFIIVILLLVSIYAHGNIALFSLLAVPFFMSIMYPTIFALGIKGLGKQTKVGSSFLVMSIIGGGVFPLIMGKISDYSTVQNSYWVLVICTLVILYFGVKGHKIIVSNESLKNNK